MMKLVWFVYYKIVYLQNRIILFVYKLFPRRRSYGLCIKLLFSRRKRSHLCIKYNLIYFCKIRFNIILLWPLHVRFLFCLSLSGFPTKIFVNVQTMKQMNLCSVYVYSNQFMYILISFIYAKLHTEKICVIVLLLSHVY
jgi:hypothetical protein